MYRDVYTANKDGVSIFISMARTQESFPVHRAGTGLRRGQPRAACSLGHVDQCEAQDGVAYAPGTGSEDGMPSAQVHLCETWALPFL